MMLSMNEFDLNQKPWCLLPIAGSMHSGKSQAKVFGSTGAEVLQSIVWFLNGLPMLAMAKWF
jgi:hypothetical protein